MFSGLLQPTHLIILLAVVLIFLGPKRLPSAGPSDWPGAQRVQGLDQPRAAAAR